MFYNISYQIIMNIVYIDLIQYKFPKNLKEVRMISRCRMNYINKTRQKSLALNT